jgi:predicted DNA-binding antitoxin AbrB/MazE fold protein
VRNGVIVLDEPAPLEEGAEVTVEIIARETPTLSERLAAVIGKADGLPEDAAENFEHYLYGAPKQR